ncbi:cytosol aminopeptidase [bacterium MnTg02]|nr:cytosol aminopeptidase [bacterium MnTg02]
MIRKSKTSHDLGLAGLLLTAESRKKTCPIWLVSPGDADAGLEGLTKAQRVWLENSGWRATVGSHALLPDEKGNIAGVVFCQGERENGAAAGIQSGVLSRVLPQGDYHFANDNDSEPELAGLSWLLGAYRFGRYSSEAPPPRPRLKLPKGTDIDHILAIANGVELGRDLINTPANDLGPEELEEAVQRLAKTHGAQVKVIRGDDLVAKNYPMIHAVGRASTRQPRLIDLSWGKKGAPKITLVGKGICFDTGGLNIKPGSSMTLMKKDMGGAAAVLALGSMIMQSRLKVNLRILIPAAENSISGNAFRPGDILPSRDGMTVEIGNTDAEGRLVLADALSLADEQKPDYLISMATLTGAARVALGPDLPPFYTDDDGLAGEIANEGDNVGDPVWRLPFWKPYDALLQSKVADVSHISDGPFAGSITAALFLKRFVKQTHHYIHFDIYGWTPQTSGSRVQGGEPQGARALFAWLSAKFAD